MQDIARIDRQQGGGAAKQHREQIEGNRAQHDGLAAHVGDSRGQALQPAQVGFRRMAHAAAADSGDHHRNAHQQDHAYAIGHRSTQQVDRAAQRGPEYDPGLEG